MSRVGVLGRGTRIRTSNDKQRLSPEDPNFLKKRYGGLEPDRLKNTAQEDMYL